MTAAIAADVIKAQHEAERLSALSRFDILDTPREEAFDRIVRLTRKLMDVPMALVSFIDAHRQWYKACEGFNDSEVPREATFCRKIIESCKPLVVPDTAGDERFAQSPFVVGPPFIRCYAGVPLTTTDGQIIGSLCAIDTRPRDFDGVHLELLSDLASIVMHELELRTLIARDSLTGAYSRRALLEEAGRAAALALRHHDDLSCLAFDLDHFKAVNDTHGHAAGDHVLARILATCEQHLRKGDTVGRVGGEEFVILLPQTDLQGAVEVAEKLRKAIEQETINVGAAELRITASFGVTALGRTTRDVATLLERADEALYDAKRQGRNRVSQWCGADQAVYLSRRRVLKGGRILFNGHSSSIDCTVRTLSDEGAGLDVSSSAGIPKRFDLEIRADHFLRPIRVVSQTEKHLEVEFV